MVRVDLAGLGGKQQLAAGEGARRRYSWRSDIRENPSSGRRRGRLSRLRVLIFHGYLLHGTGSNVYNAELGAALVRAGHELHLSVRTAPRSRWTGSTRRACGSRELVVEQRRSPPRATVYRPDIGGLLPVYVADATTASGAPVHRAQRGRGRRLHGRQRRRRTRGRGASAAGRRAGQPPGDGTGDPRPRAGETSRTRSRSTAARWSTRSSRTRASGRSRPRGSRARGGVLVGSRHTAETCGPRWRTRRCRGAPGSARRAWTSRASPRAPERPARAWPPDRLADVRAVRAGRRRSPRDRRHRLLVRSRRARGGRGAGHGRAGGPADRLRGQADRVQGRRAAARRVCRSCSRASRGRG